MLMLLSPSKTLDETPCRIPLQTTMPDFLSETIQLHALLKRKKSADLQKLMGISAKLAEQNYARFQSFAPAFTEANAKPALLMFKGDVYTPMKPECYDAETLAYAQDHLRILSGFYGLLRPLDLMLPYRLEMGTQLANKRGKDLYAFWGGRLSKALNKAGEGMRNPLLVNLVSEEYFKAVDEKTLKLPLVHIQFKEYRDGAYKIIGLMAKRARGMMADYILRQRVDTLEGLKDFAAGGYCFQPNDSTPQLLFFTRV